MKLLSTLKNQEADNCFILTYNLDLAFFEYMLFAPLYINGCRNVVVICDPNQYQKALEDLSILRFVGQRYLLIPAQTSLRGVFHPKMILQTGQESGSLTITSGNLTRSGYTQNLEVGTHIQYSSRRPDAKLWSVISWAYQTLGTIVAKSDIRGLVTERLDQLYSTTPWLREPPAVVESDNFWCLSNLEESLFDQVFRLIGENDPSPIAKISILSPFFDHKLKAANTLIDKFEPTRMNIYSKNPIGLDPASLILLSDQFPGELTYQELAEDSRVLHAKVIKIDTAKGSWVVAGSANLSAAAWLNTANNGNTEIITLRFEDKSEYFLPWFEEATGSSRTKPFSEISFTKIDWEVQEVSDAIKLLSASLKGDQITLEFSKSVEGLEDLILKLDVGFTTIELKDFHTRSHTEFVFRVADSKISLLNSPTLCWIEYAESGIESIETNQELLINLDALTRYSRPVDKRQRPKIIKGIEPESYEHCVQILDMMESMLARSTEDLDRHQRRLGKREQEIERQMAIEEEGEYIPKEHFVDEPVRLPARSSGEEFYADYFDRLTYDSLLSAVLQIIYQPAGAPKKQENIPLEDPPDEPLDEPTETETIEDADLDEEAKTKQLARIETKANTLVSRFLSGLRDDQFLEEVPPVYLVETFLIVVYFLRIVWLDGYLSEEKFTGYVFDLLKAIWGWPGEKGAWDTLKARIDKKERREFEERLGLSGNIWLIVYLLGNLFELQGREEYYLVAAWARNVQDMFESSATLNVIPLEVFETNWRYFFPKAVEKRTPKDIDRWLGDYLDEYDDFTLISEITAKPASRAEITRTNTANINQVPSLIVRTPLFEKDINHCFDLFKIFISYPRTKENAWAKFENVNPPIHSDDIRKVVIFYSSILNSFEFVAEREKEGVYDPDISKDNISIQEILERDTYRDFISEP